MRLTFMPMGGRGSTPNCSYSRLAQGVSNEQKWFKSGVIERVFMIIR